jgi:hypothetical protein
LRRVTASLAESTAGGARISMGAADESNNKEEIA